MHLPWLEYEKGICITRFLAADEMTKLAFSSRRVDEMCVLSPVDVAYPFLHNRQQGMESNEQQGNKPIRSCNRSEPMTDNAAVIAAWVAASAAMLSVIVYAVQAWFNRKQVKVSQDQMSLSQQQLWVSQDQVKVSQEQAFAMVRPVLFPFGSEKPGSSLQDVISIRNAGPGTALNICGVVFGQKPANPREKETLLRRLWFANPLPPGEPPVIALNLQGTSTWRGDSEIRNQQHTYSLYATQRTLEELSKGLVPIVERLTLTYHDVFGLKHASIFDRTHLQAWEFVALLLNIPKDIADMEREAE